MVFREESRLGPQMRAHCTLIRSVSTLSIWVTERGQVDILHLEDLFSSDAKIKCKLRTKQERQKRKRMRDKEGLCGGRGEGVAQLGG